MTSTEASVVEPPFRTADVLRITGVHRQTLRNWIRKGLFPAPKKIGRTRYWDRRVVEDAVKTHQAGDLTNG